MKQYPEIRWENIAEQAITKYLDKLILLDHLTKECELTEADAEEIGEMSKERAWKKLLRTQPQCSHPFIISDHFDES